MSENRNFFGPIDNVTLADYKQDYPAKFKKEIERIKPVFLKNKVNFYHIGSTAIPEILSKPIIDIAIELELFPLSEKEIDLISELDYKYWAANPNKNYHFFFRNLPRTHHLHIYPRNYQKLADQLKFRDKLISDKNLRKQYQDIKIKSCKKHKLDREKYTEEKADFVKYVLGLIPNK